MFHQQGCHGRVLIGSLPDAIQAELASLPGEWLEYDAASGAIVVRHIQPTATPCLPTIVSELVRMLAAVPVDLHAGIGGGDLLVHTEDSPHVVRLRVDRGGGLRITWAHPCFANAPRQPYAAARIEIDPVFCRLSGDVTLGAADAARAAKEIQRLADTFEGLYPEGDFEAAADRKRGTVQVHMRDANVDVRLLVGRVLKIAAPGSAEGAIEVSSFDERYPDDRIRVVFERGQAWVEEAALFDETSAGGIGA
jgi:hypothetical protein